MVMIIAITVERSSWFCSNWLRLIGEAPALQAVPLVEGVIDAKKKRLNRSIKRSTRKDETCRSSPLFASVRGGSSRR